MVKIKPMTIPDLLELEPRIKQVIPLVRYERNWHAAYIRAKRIAAPLVGWSSVNEDTATSEAYEVFIQYICGELDKIYG